MMGKIVVRPFEPKDRADVRRISVETAFLGKGRGFFMDDDEILADALTLYFTDHEPVSSFVAVDVDKDRVVGYLTGTLDAKKMARVFALRIFPRLLGKALMRGFFVRAKHGTLFFQGVRSLLRGEFHVPVSLKDYPALLHINIDEEGRGSGAGRRLIEAFLKFLEERGISGVHCGTMCPVARGFFLKMGFSELHASTRSWMKYRLGADIPYYILGKRIGSS